MNSLKYLLLGSLVLTLATSAPVDAKKVGGSTIAFKVDDQGGFFSQAAIDKANALIVRLKKEHHKDLVIETIKKVPDGNPDTVMDKLSAKQFDREQINGVLILLSMEPHKLRVRVGNVTREKLFTDSDAEALKEMLIKNLKEGKESKQYDKALVEATEFVCTTIAGRDQHAASQAKKDEINWPLWIGIGIGALLLLWLIMGIARAAAAPRGGYGGGYGGGGYGGGGGGGFFSSLLGGMFGAAAGMWMYSHFFGGSTHTSSPADGGVGGDAGTQGTDVGEGSTGTGGDWGDNGNDVAGGGGGGGGGDWGGGGGDAGGGDWGGGGGGGDWGGGGGGDWGGGGGGGDW